VTGVQTCALPISPTKRKNTSITNTNTITSTEADENETSTPVNKIIKLDNAIIPENHETTATSMARLMSLTASNHNNSHKKYSRVSNKKRQSDVLNNCYKINDLEMDEQQKRKKKWKKRRKKQKRNIILCRVQCVKSHPPRGVVQRKRIRNLVIRWRLWCIQRTAHTRRFA